MNQETPYIKYLKNMKAKLQAQEMSVMIGAGFSKNVDNNLYPTWWGLLRDMVTLMHGRKFQTDYEQIRPPSKRPVIKDFMNEQCDRYINEVGPLNVASKYMELRGYRESVDAYIEFRTPYIVNRDGEKFLKHYVDEVAEEKPLSDSDLSAHRRLVNLPWNNIYTTNYDNLLEESIDQNIEFDINNQIAELKNGIEELDTQNSDLQTQISFLKEKLEKLKDEGNDENLIAVNQDRPVETENIHIKDTEALAENDKEQRKVENNIHQHQMDIDTNERQLKLKEKELNKLRSLLKTYPSVVVRSSQLALKRTRNIIKLHGSRRTEKDNEFGFDDDSRKQYVLTQEDFDTYPVKHEAFTQLMRISLLQESFCLIGFSGEDPNFLAWIGWVRDVLFKDKTEPKEDRAEKIYLINVSDPSEKKGSDYGKSIFYENQRIAEIPLREVECLDFLEAETGRKLSNRSSVKDILNLLFDYLHSASSLAGPGLAIELSYRTKFNQLCDRLPRFAKDADMKSILGDFSLLDGMLKYNRFPSLIYSYDIKRQWFLNQSGEYLALVENNPDQLETYLKAVSFFLRVQLYPLSIFGREMQGTFEKMLTYSKDISPRLYGEFLLHHLKDAIWTDNQSNVKTIVSELENIECVEIVNERFFLTALYALLQCDFERLEKILSEWNATDHWVTKKAGLLSNIDRPGSIAILQDNQLKIAQEYFYKLELDKYLDGSLSFSDSQKSEEFKSLRDSGLNTIANSLDYLFNEIKEKEDKILPYGEGKFTIKNSFFLSNSNKYLQSMQFVGLMLDSGYPFSNYYGVFYAAEKVYPAMKNVQEYYWLAVIQSVLQFNDYKFVKRMAQDFVLCNYGKAVFKKACSYLQKAYLSKKTPEHFKDGILIFLAELINVVAPNFWEGFFLEVWNQKLEIEIDQSDRRSEWHKYLNKGLNLIQTSGAFCHVIKDACKMGQNREKFDFAVQYLYELASNPFLRVDATAINTAVDKELEEVIRRIPQDPNTIFLVGNLNVVLSPNNKDQIYNVLNELDFHSVNNARSWRVFLYYTKDDSDLLDRLKKAILENKSLWDAGFIEKGLTHKDFISIHDLRKNNDGYPGLVWSDSEILVIYGRLKEVFQKIENYLKNHGDREFFSDVLQEMVSFLKDESDRLAKVTGYNELLQKIVNALNSQRAFDNALKGIISKDQNKVLRSLDEIMEIIFERKDWSEGKNYLNILANKILLQNGPALEACLNALSVVIYDFRHEDEPRIYSQILVSILTQFRDSPLENGDQPFIEERLVRIAFVLDQWKVKDEVLKHYLKLLRSSRFNNVRYNLSNSLSS
jgi:hypothetical protein